MNKSSPLPCKRDRTRAAIIQAALQVLAERGEGASIDEIMAKACMARGTFYNYFDDRQILWREVLVALRASVREGVMLRIPEALPPEAVLACMISGLLQFSLDRPVLGWAIVRLGTGKEWLTKHSLEEQVFPRSDEALQLLVGQRVPFAIAQAYIEASLSLALRRLLEGHIGLDEAEKLLGLTLRGLGVEDGAASAAMVVAADFARSLRQP